MAAERSAASGRELSVLIEHARIHAQAAPIPLPPRSSTGDWMAALRDDVVALADALEAKLDA